MDAKTERHSQIQHDETSPAAIGLFKGRNAPLAGFDISWEGTQVSSWLAVGAQLRYSRWSRKFTPSKVCALLPLHFSSCLKGTIHVL